MLVGWHLGSCPLLAPPPSLVAAQLVGQPAGRHCDQPATWIPGDALIRPLERGGEHGFLHGVLGQVEVAAAADECTEDLRRELAQQVLGADFGLGSHISAPAVSMSGLTSTAQKRAAGSWATISAARSGLSASST